LTYAFLGIEYKHFMCCDKGLNEGFVTTKNALVWLVEHLTEAEAPNCNIALMNTKLGLAEALAADKQSARATRSATMSAHGLAASMAVLVLVLVVVVMVPLSSLAWQRR
jgi:hypothetical protein